MIIEMFTALPSSILQENFLCYVSFSYHSLFPSIFVVEISSIIFKGFIILSFPLSPHFSQSLFPEAVPPGCPLGLLPSCHPGASSHYIGESHCFLDPVSTSLFTLEKHILRKGAWEQNFLDLRSLNMCVCFFKPYFFDSFKAILLNILLCWPLSKWRKTLDSLWGYQSGEAFSQFWSCEPRVLWRIKITIGNAFQRFTMCQALCWVLYRNYLNPHTKLMR